MAVPVVIDGYNLLYARGEAPSAESRDRLVREVGQWARARGRRAVIVFDAWAGGERREREELRGPVTVYFTRYGERADDRIVRWVSERPEAVVVTSDRDVRRAVSRRGAAVLDSTTFAARLEAALAAADAGSPREDDDESRPGRHLGRHATWLRGL
ncbi:MAG: NYN domain-containing protein [Candidatus Rokuibacteriota bacterium]